MAVSHPLTELVTLEAGMLGAASRADLRHATLAPANRLVGGELGVWVDRPGRRPRLRATSHVGRAERNTPFAQWLERELAQQDWSEAQRFTLQGAEAHTPLRHALLAPFPGGRGALVFLNDSAFDEAAVPVARRVAQLAQACTTAKRARARRARSAWPWVAAAGVAGAMALPVPLSTLAPAEIVPSAPFHVTAPFDGVIAEVMVVPYSEVREGDPLLRMESTELQASADIAAKDERLARTRARRAELASFSDPSAKAERAIAGAEAELAAARRSHALAKLARSELSSPRAGIALMEDAGSWEGRPVRTGQTIIEIADPEARELLLRVPLSSGEDLLPGASIRLFLDGDPSRSVEATLTRSAFRASEQPDGSLAFEARADLSGDLPRTARIGAQGVAKIRGQTAPLGWWLARKPVTALRQMFGI